VINILVTDKLAEEGLDLLNATENVEVTVKTGISEDELAQIIGDYDGLIIRSGTQVTAKVLENSGRLRGIARAGVGVDNVDVSTATEKGIVVMNTPDGNTISAAEHTIALMMALSRHVVGGCTTLKAGKWDRKSFVGTQLMGKTLGVIGLGRIGMAVARRALGLNMKVIAFDPLAAPEAAREAGIELSDQVDEICKICDYLTLHVPVTDETRGMINADRLAMMKPSARIINVARGPIVNEDALYDALESGQIAGAALDVFAQEPPENRRFEALDTCIVTPHLGASTEEAQVEVAVDAVNELVDALQGKQMRNAVNVPGLDSSLPEAVRQFRSLAERIGMVVSSIAEGNIQKVQASYRGEIASMDCSALTTAFTVGLLQRRFEVNLNVVNAPHLAKQRGISIDEIKNPECEDYMSTIGLRVKTETGERLVVGTIFGRKNLKIIKIDDFYLEVEPAGTLIIVFNDDRPGVIGRMGMVCGKNNINIGTMGVGRVREENCAVLALDVDQTPSEECISEFHDLDFVKNVYICQLPD
jgi:D-3-phosphoglycerate dehydrogenase